MNTKHTPESCPRCGTEMKNCGAPIWEDYCPNKECTWDRDEMFRRVREDSAKHKAQERIRDVAPELLAMLKDIRNWIDEDLSAWEANTIPQIDALIAKAEGRKP